MARTANISIRLNGRIVESTCAVRTSLADFLRDTLGLTGTRVGCEQGVCGACTVAVDGTAMRSCLMLAVQADGHEIMTVEGLGGEGGGLGPLQAAFMDCHGLQCGYCTSGMLVTAALFLEANPAPSEEEVREAMAGNLCRCTGYQQIVDAIVEAGNRISELAE